MRRSPMIGRKSWRISPRADRDLLKEPRIKLSMQEMTVPSKDHRCIMLIRGFDDFFVANGSARLNGCGCTGFDSGNQSVGEGEKGVTGNNTAFQAESCLLGFPKQRGDRSRRGTFGQLRFRVCGLFLQKRWRWTSRASRRANRNAWLRFHPRSAVGW